MLENLLNSKIDLENYNSGDIYIQRIGNAFKELQDSDIFGGSIFLPIGNETQRNELRHKHNTLREDIRRVEVNALNGGGFIVLR
jgi:hypothetical protein